MQYLAWQGFAVFTRCLREGIVSRDTLKSLLTIWSKVHMLIRTSSFHALISRSFRKKIQQQEKTKDQLLCVLTPDPNSVPYSTLPCILLMEFLKHWEKMRTQMSMIARTDVEMFDLLKYGQTSLQEAGHLCSVKTADVYNCYQVRATRGSDFQNQILIIKRKPNRKTKQIFQFSSYLTRSSTK